MASSSAPPRSTAAAPAAAVLAAVEGVGDDSSGSVGGSLRFCQSALPQHIREWVGRIIRLERSDLGYLAARTCKLSRVDAGGTCVKISRDMVATAGHVLIDPNKIEETPRFHDPVDVAYFPMRKIPAAFEFDLYKESATFDVAFLKLKGSDIPDGCIRPGPRLPLLDEKVRLVSYPNFVDVNLLLNGEDRLLHTIPPISSSFRVGTVAPDRNLAGDYMSNSNSSGGPVMRFDRALGTCVLLAIHCSVEYSGINEQLDDELLDVPENATGQSRTVAGRKLYPWIVERVICSKELGNFAPITLAAADAGFTLEF